MCTVNSLQALALEADTGLSLQTRRTRRGGGGGEVTGGTQAHLVGFQRSVTSEAKGITAGSQAAWHRAHRALPARKNLKGTSGLHVQIHLRSESLKSQSNTTPSRQQAAS